jgi:hypothetical protein
VSRVGLGSSHSRRSAARSTISGSIPRPVQPAMKLLVSAAKNTCANVAFECRLPSDRGSTAIAEAVAARSVAERGEEPRCQQRAGDRGAGVGRQQLEREEAEPQAPPACLPVDATIEARRLAGAVEGLRGLDPARERRPQPGQRRARVVPHDSPRP